MAMTPRLACFVTVLVAGLAAVPARGDATLLSHTRSVSGIGIDKQGTPEFPIYVEIPGSISSSDTGAFNETLVLGNFQPFVAKQSSTITPTLLAGTGEAFATNAYVKLTKVAGGEGFSKFEVDFSIDTATEFWLYGFVQSKQGLPFGHGSLNLDGPVSLSYSNIASFDPLVEFNTTGVLLPGAYKLTVLAAGYEPGPPGAVSHGAFEFTMLIPAPWGVPVLAVLALAGRRRRA